MHISVAVGFSLFVKVWSIVPWSEWKYFHYSPNWKGQFEKSACSHTEWEKLEQFQQQKLCSLVVKETSTDYITTRQVLWGRNNRLFKQQLDALLQIYLDEKG